MNQVACLVMAAGGSRRFGTSKQLVVIRGKALLLHSVEAALASGCQPVVVVLGDQAERIEPCLASLAVRCVLNPTWQSGLGSSIACGVSALTEGIDAAVVLLADQYGIASDHLRNLVDQFSSNPEKIVATRTGDCVGPPTLFPAKFFPELRSLSGDHGARSILNQHAGQVLSIPAPESLRDIDTLGDLP